LQFLPADRVVTAIEEHFRGVGQHPDKGTDTGDDENDGQRLADTSDGGDVAVTHRGDGDDSEIDRIRQRKVFHHHESDGAGDHHHEEDGEINDKAQFFCSGIGHDETPGRGKAPFQ